MTDVHAPPARLARRRLAVLGLVARRVRHAGAVARRSSRPTSRWSSSTARPRSTSAPTSSGSWRSGSDARPGEDMTRTRGDALQLIGMNTKTGAAAAIGIPRDSYVDIPGVGHDKINAALYYGGPELLGEAVGNLIGIQPDYVFVTRFEKFQAMIGDDRRHRRRQPDLVQRRLPQARRASRPGKIHLGAVGRAGLRPDPPRPAPRRLRPLGQPAAGAARHPGQDPRARRPPRLHRVGRARPPWRTWPPTPRRPSSTGWPAPRPR